MNQARYPKCDEFKPEISIPVRRKTLNVAGWESFRAPSVSANP